MPPDATAPPGAALQPGSQSSSDCVLAIDDACEQATLQEVRVRDFVAKDRAGGRLDAHIKNLADSILSVGLLQPPHVVLTEGDALEVIVGGNRALALQLARIETCLAFVWKKRPHEVLIRRITLAENVVRADLGLAEKYAELKQLHELTGGTRQQLARSNSLSEATVSRLFKAADRVPADVISMPDLGDTHKYVLSALPSHDAIRRIARTVIEQRLTVKQTEQLVKDEAKPAKGSKKRVGTVKIRLDSLDALAEDVNKLAARVNQMVKNNDLKQLSGHTLLALLLREGKAS